MCTAADRPRAWHPHLPLSPFAMQLINQRCALKSRQMNNLEQKVAQVNELLYTSEGGGLLRHAS